MDESFKKGVKHPESEEGLFWEEWVGKHPDKKEEVNVARQIILFMNFETHYLSKSDINTLWEKLNKRTEEREQTVFPKAQPRRGVFYPVFPFWHKVAAVFIGLVVLSASLFFILQRDNTLQYRTQFGETKNLLLPDSSTVILNANSKLTYSSDWNSKDLRKVWLEGEAFFSVVHTANDQKSSSIRPTLM